MRYKHITPDQVVPKYIRKKVYKECIDKIKNYNDNDNEIQYDTTSMGLCMLLYCVLWQLNSYMDSAPNGEMWNFYYANISFPEFTNEYKEEIEDEYGDMYNRNNKRIEILERILSQM